MKSTILAFILVLIMAASYYREANGQAYGVNYNRYNSGLYGRSNYNARYGGGQYTPDYTGYTNQYYNPYNNYQYYAYSYPYSRLYGYPGYGTYGYNPYGNTYGTYGAGYGTGYGAGGVGAGE
ncbi:unnamed protein product, partial [Oppiella nova]